MLVRTLHWVVPSYSIWGLPFFLFYSTRLSQFLYERPGQGILRSMLCRLMAPLVWTLMNMCACSRRRVVYLLLASGHLSPCIACHHHHAAGTSNRLSDLV